MFKVCQPALVHFTGNRNSEFGAAQQFQAGDEKMPTGVRAGESLPRSKE